MVPIIINDRVDIGFHARKYDESTSRRREKIPTSVIVRNHVYHESRESFRFGHQEKGSPVSVFRYRFPTTVGVSTAITDTTFFCVFRSGNETYLIDPNGKHHHRYVAVNAERIFYAPDLDYLLSIYRNNFFIHFFLVQR